MNYDRLYDMPSIIQLPDVIENGHRMIGNTMEANGLRSWMRGTGVEPVSLSAPDPKSHSAPVTAASPLSTECAPATDRHRSLPNATQSTTASATWLRMGAE